MSLISDDLTIAYKASNLLFLFREIETKFTSCRVKIGNFRERLILDLSKLVINVAPLSEPGRFCHLGLDKDLLHLHYAPIVVRIK